MRGEVGKEKTPGGGERVGNAEDIEGGTRGESRYGEAAGGAGGRRIYRGDFSDLDVSVSSALGYSQI